MGPSWGPPGSCRSLMSPMMTPWTLQSGNPYINLIPITTVETVEQQTLVSRPGSQSTLNMNFLIWVDNNRASLPPHLQPETVPQVESIENVGDWSSSLSQPLMKKPHLIWNISYQIPKSLFSKCIRLGSSFSKMTVISFTECLRQEIKISSHVVALVIGARVCSVVRQPLTIVTSRLEQQKVVNTNVFIKWCA